MMPRYNGNSLLSPSRLACSCKLESKQIAMRFLMFSGGSEVKLFLWKTIFRKEKKSITNRKKQFAAKKKEFY